jgi:DNA-binding PadR family transcriptional regulator
MDTTPDGELDALLLAVISAGPMYTDEIVATLHERSHGAYDERLDLVFEALTRLNYTGYLDSRWPYTTGRRRINYTLTGKGRRALETWEANPEPDDKSAHSSASSPPED